MFVRLNAWIRGRRVESDHGIAMVLVIGVTSVIGILIVAAVAFSVSGITSAKRTDDWSGALAAAYAGVEEYQSRLASDPAYLQYGNSASGFSGTSVFIPELAGKQNPAFKLGAGTDDWARVPGVGGPSKARFRYEVDNSKYTSGGVVKIRSTGLVGNIKRSIVADLKQEGFIDFLYFTDYEIQDPALSGTSVTNCVKHAEEGRPTSSPGNSNPCGNIAFGAGDVLNGPVHTNDQIRACSATFKQEVTTSSSLLSNGKRYLNADSNGSTSGCTAPTFALGSSYPEFKKSLVMPPTNLELKKETRKDLESVIQATGCLYTGPTSIRFLGNGKMTVRSPWTKATQVKGEPASQGVVNSECGSPGAAGLGSAAGATFNVPDNRVIYVQSVPASAGDPNTPGAGSPTVSSFCTGVDGGYGNGIGYPRASEWVADPTKSYNCTYGDLFVEGTVDSKTTLASAHYIYVTGDLKYKSAQDDVLGLVGQDAIFVWNPVQRTSCSGSGASQVCSYSSLLPDNREINAAMLSVAHTFQVQNFDRGGDQGTLTVNGAIAQYFRGTVRQGTLAAPNGFKKQYNYDSRFKFIAPPKFLSPVTITYGVTRWIEVDQVNDAGSN